MDEDAVAVDENDQNATVAPGQGDACHSASAKEEDLATPDGLRQGFLRATRGASLGVKERTWKFFVRAYPHMRKLFLQGKLRSSFRTLQRAQEQMMPDIHVTVCYEDGATGRPYRLHGRVLKPPLSPQDKKIWEKVDVKVSHTVTVIET